MMDDVTKRKLNILIYLAKIDGQFHKAERKLLLDFVTEKGFDEKEFYLLSDQENQILSPEKIKDKAEMMFLILKLIQADRKIATEEFDFASSLAEKLGYKKEIVSEMADQLQLSRISFEAEEGKWRISRQ